MKFTTTLLVSAAMAAGCGTSSHNDKRSRPGLAVTAPGTTPSPVAPSPQNTASGVDNGFGPGVKVIDVTAGGYQFKYTVFEDQQAPITFANATEFSRQSIVSSRGLAFAANGLKQRLFFEIYPLLTCADAASLLTSNGQGSVFKRTDGTSVSYAVRNDRSADDNQAQIIAVFAGSEVSSTAAPAAAVAAPGTCLALAFYASLPAGLSLQLGTPSPSANVISTVLNSFQKN